MATPLLSPLSAPDLLLWALLPLCALLLVSLLVLPALLRPEGNPAAVARAAGYLLGVGLGIVLLVSGSLGPLYTLFAQQRMDRADLALQAALAVIGLLLIALHAVLLRSVDPVSRALPAAVFRAAWQFVGLLLVILGILSVLDRIVRHGSLSAPDRVAYLLTMLVGLLLLWFSCARPAPAASARPPAPLRPATPPPPRAPLIAADPVPVNIPVMRTSAPAPRVAAKPKAKAASRAPKKGRKAS